jgi:hypothetical protein
MRKQPVREAPGRELGTGKAARREFSHPFLKVAFIKTTFSKLLNRVNHDKRVELLDLKTRISFAAVKFEASSPMVGAPAGGETLLIEGRRFNNLQHPPTVWIGPNKASDVRLSNTRVLCMVPAGVGRNLQVRVTPSVTLYPNKPILGQTEHLEIAGETKTLRTCFLYNGENRSRLSLLHCALAFLPPKPFKSHTLLENTSACVESPEFWVDWEPGA